MILYSREAGIEIEDIYRDNSEVHSFYYGPNFELEAWECCEVSGYKVQRTVFVANGTLFVYCHNFLWMTNGQRTVMI